MGSPWLGASLSRTLRGMIVRKTRLPKWRWTSSTTCRERWVRGSNMVITRPRRRRWGFSDRRTRSSVRISWESPSSARYSHWTGMMTPLLAATSALTVRMPRLGGQSIRT